MQKWKQEFPSLKQTLNKDESGVTLVELLAAISLLSVVILLAGSLHVFGQRHFINQKDSASQANDFSYAMTIISTELRKQSAAEVKVDDHTILIDDKETFYVSDNNLYHELTVIAESVDYMLVEEVENGLNIQLHSSSEATQDKKYETTIYFRR